MNAKQRQNTGDETLLR